MMDGSIAVVLHLPAHDRHASHGREILPAPVPNPVGIGEPALLQALGHERVKFFSIEPWAAGHDGAGLGVQTADLLDLRLSPFSRSSGMPCALKASSEDGLATSW